MKAEWQNKRFPPVRRSCPIKCKHYGIRVCYLRDNIKYVYKLEYKQRRTPHLTC